ncbi:ferrous iron transport protein B [Candidatus Beckwithbacteria bacterium RBG_13_35_6]|uniref:Ferrous iron transport protein B n=1 Tax=Candidatus Beckwithbacteria bacterium RBG_13_35_6 TaxID=1797456 RepID=A0A1F5DF73_9BACT|nr:MAG: ferrous iron transport protein B [Candidatus Beckwithbacteria bacterium RBG_13_35_6]
MLNNNKDKKTLNIVLAGQANVGKSVIFNYLTGLHQHVGNWPGKTVEKALGTLYYQGYTINILDLPGIYSLSTYSQEELISREYIATQKPDFIINVINGLSLERNLLFTLQLLELEQPLVIALNMVNLWKEKGITVDLKILVDLLGVPVVPVAAIYNKGLTRVLDEGIKLTKQNIYPKPLRYGVEVEREIAKLIEKLKSYTFSFPLRWLAIKLLEKDKEVEKLVCTKNPQILKEAKNSILQLEKIHGHDSSVIIANERCIIVSELIKKSLKIVKPLKRTLGEKFDALSTHRIWGYPIMLLIFVLIFLTIFKFGNSLSGILENITLEWQLGWQNIFGKSLIASLGWTVVQSILALIQLAIPYIITFYFMLYFLEGWGYLARIAFLTDSLMHKIGIHGKACIPLLLGLGCNVPACLSCRILETARERFLTGVLVTFIPCSAVTVIILGLVGKSAGLNWALGLYLLNLLVIFMLGKILFKILPGEATELIMEMPDYHKPHLKTILIQTWYRLREFLFLAGPIVVFSGIIIQGLYLVGLLNPIARILNPITVGWLGLPSMAGILLIFGILRKELILVMLASILGTSNFAQVLSFSQIITLGMVSMFYIPCVATIGAFYKEFGLKNAVGIAVFKIVFAIILGGLFYRFLLLF